MKRKQVTETIANVGAASFTIKGSMTLLNHKAGKNVEIDMPSTLAVIRGVLVWVDSLLEDGKECEPSATANLRDLLTRVGASIAYDHSDSDEAE